MVKEYVMPTKPPIVAGWDDPTRWVWPGEVVHRMTTNHGKGKKVIQFLLYDKKENAFMLKTWNQEYLVTIDDSARMAEALRQVVTDES